MEFEKVGLRLEIIYIHGFTTLEGSYGSLVLVTALDSTVRLSVSTQTAAVRALLNRLYR